MPTIADAERFYRQYHGAQETGMPKYRRLRGLLEAALRDDFWKVGDRLPTEHAIAEVTSYSLGTVQRAIRELVDSGVLVRIAGRGTFVVKSSQELGEPFVSARFLDDRGEGLLPVYASVLEVHHGQFGARVERALKPMAGEVVCIERIFNVANEFRVFSRFYVDGTRFPKFQRLTQAELNSPNLKLLLMKSYQLAPITHRQTLEFFTIPAGIARHIGCRPGEQGWLQSITGSTEPEVNVYLQELVVPPNKRTMELPDTVLPKAV